MRGTQREKGNSDNPFSEYQTIYASLFSNILAPSDGEYKAGVNDAVYFNTALLLDETMQADPKILAKVGDKKTINLGRETSLTGYLKSVSVKDDEIKGKKTKKVEIVLFDPEAKYNSPIGDKDDPRNGEVCGELYVISSAFTLKSKELLGKLANVAADEKINIAIVRATTKESGRKTPMTTKDGKAIYNVLVFQNEKNISPKFAELKYEWVDGTDAWVIEYNKIIEENQDEDRRNAMDKFFRKYVDTVMNLSAHELFLSRLNKLGYDLVDNGVNKDGTKRMKYVKLGTTSNETVVEDEAEFVDAGKDEGDDLPF